MGDGIAHHGHAAKDEVAAQQTTAGRHQRAGQYDPKGVHFLLLIVKWLNCLMVKLLIVLSVFRILNDP
jgi:hypothetical protein